ncbi:MAG: N-acetylneuraminate synthase [Paludibacter sp.]|nr:N-acetylneuraminate synthase [Paludibacter sp.]
MPKTIVIAEAGVNHNGNIKLAYKLVEAAKNAGADIVKFQTFVPEYVVSKFAQKAEYQKINTGTNETQLDMVKKLALSFNDFVKLKKYSDNLGIEFLSTPFDTESIDFLSGLGLKLWKIPSGEITNYPYLAKIAKTRCPIIMSTGMCTMKDIEDALFLLRKNGAENITLLHCTTEYPAPYDEVNLRAMQTLKNHFDLNTGYSDHTKGIEIAVAAVAMGASVIEKHFTLDRNLPGPDHKASLIPSELETMVKAIRNVEAAMGSDIKEPSVSEIKNLAVARKSIVAKRSIKSGELFTEENITVKRPGNGISPMKWNDVISMCAKRDFSEDEPIEL